MLDLMIRGGPIMWPIAFCSLAAAVIIIERLIYFRKIHVDEDSLISRMKAALQKGHHEEALAICEGKPSPFTNLMKVGIEHRHYPKQVIREAIMDAASLETPKLERYLNSLGTISNIAPLLGLLGTVTGNIKAFGVIGSLGAVGDPRLLASGIAEALLTTAAGIIVALPAVIFYNYLVGKVNHMILRMETMANELVLLLEGGK